MSLLAEYALTPDVFDSTSYANDEVGDIRLQHLKEVLLHEGLVRDLRDGQWFSLFSLNNRPWHLRGKELLKKLKQQGRLQRHSPSLPSKPETDEEWCKEALSSHGNSPLSGIIVTCRVKNSFSGEPLVAAIDRLTGAPWWCVRDSSVRLIRNRSAYEGILRPVLQYANHIMFIDRNLDPSRTQYREFAEILRRVAGRRPSPVIEIHRVCYSGSGPNRNIIDNQEWESRFTYAWATILSSIGVSVEVFIWDHFHDRYLISDLIGISVPNGFDTTTNQTDMTTWSRLKRQDRDDVQKEFDPATNRHKILYRFKLP